MSIPTCCGESNATRSLTAEPARFHLSLNVRELDRSVAFLRALLGCEPTKCRADYAKFELDDPPLVLSLEPCAVAPGGNLNHLGFRVSSSAALVDLQRRLELAGISTRREEGVECCYARQTKFWVMDPDSNLWEVYTLDEDIEHRGDGRLPIIEAPPSADDAAGPAASIWRHQLGQPFPARLPILDGTVDLVQLEGTFNERLADEQLRGRMSELLRVLRPGGHVEMHLLTADREVTQSPLALPGPAAAVQAVPVGETLLRQLAKCGFQNPRYSFHATNACFHAGDAELRETRITAEKP